jgi:hypothetical protein
VPRPRSAVITHHAHPWVRALGLACLLTALWVSFASAQTRRAAIRVNVTVLDAAVSDVLGAALDGDAWRITAAGSPELSVRAERIGTDRRDSRGTEVAICEALDEVVTKCRDQRLPVLEMSGASRDSGLVVRLRRNGGAPVRLTLAYTGT